MTASDHAVELTRAAALAAHNKLAENIVCLDVSEQLVISDSFVVCQGTTERHVTSIVDGVEEALLKLRAKPLRREGDAEARWVLLDFGEIVVHVFHPEDRAEKALERIWKDCPVIEVTYPTPADAR